jgi:hypothetical protein
MEKKFFCRGAYACATAALTILPLAAAVAADATSLEEITVTGT